MYGSIFSVCGRNVLIYRPLPKKMLYQQLPVVWRAIRFLKATHEVFNLFILIISKQNNTQTHGSNFYLRNDYQCDVWLPIIVSSRWRSEKCFSSYDSLDKQSKLMGQRISELEALCCLNELQLYDLTSSVWSQAPQLTVVSLSQVSLHGATCLFVRVCVCLKVVVHSSPSLS